MMMMTMMITLMMMDDDDVPTEEHRHEYANSDDDDDVGDVLLRMHRINHKQQNKNIYMYAQVCFQYPWFVVDCVRAKVTEEYAQS